MVLGVIFELLHKNGQIPDIIKRVYLTARAG
jgi:hypothetical protein